MDSTHDAIVCSPAAADLLTTEWRCLWLLETRMTNLRYFGFLTQPSEETKVKGQS